MRCRVCGNTIAGGQTYFNLPQGQDGVLCATCNTLAKTFCAGGCGKLIQVGTTAILGHTLFSNGTALLCADCQSLPRVVCAGGCDTLLRVGTRNVATIYSYANNVGVCETCHSLALVVCAGGCDTLLRVGTRNVATIYSYANNVGVCETCHSLALVVCAGGCNTLLRVGTRNVANYQPYSNASLCTTCQTRPLTMCIGRCNTLLVVDGTNVVAHTIYPHSLLHACNACSAAGVGCGLCNTPAALLTLPTAQQVFIGALRVDNDYRCRFCNARAVSDNPTANPLYQNVHTWIGTTANGLNLTPTRPPLTLSTRTFLNGRNGVVAAPINNNVAPSHTLGFCAFVWTGQTITERNIYIERRLTRVMFMATAAHELTHAWQYEQGLQGRQTPQIREGFPEWVAYRFLELLAAQHTEDEAEARRYMAQLSTNQDPVYGAGLQQFITAFGTGGQAGFARVLALAQAVIPTSTTVNTLT